MAPGARSAMAETEGVPIGPDDPATEIVARALAADRVAAETRHREVWTELASQCPSSPVGYFGMQIGADADRGQQERMIVSGYCSTDP